MIGHRTVQEVKMDVNISKNLIYYIFCQGHNWAVPGRILQSFNENKLS